MRLVLPTWTILESCWTSVHVRRQKKLSSKVECRMVAQPQRWQQDRCTHQPEDKAREGAAPPSLQNPGGATHFTPPPSQSFLGTSSKTHLEACVLADSKANQVDSQNLELPRLSGSASAASATSAELQAKQSRIGNCEMTPWGNVLLTRLQDMRRSILETHVVERTGTQDT